MSSPETQAMAALAEAKGQGLGRLETLEAGVFRFGMAVRAFLAAFPDDMPAPSRITPLYSGSEDGPFLHMVCPGREAVEAWAARLGAKVKVTPDGPDMAYLNVRGTLDGLRLSVTGTEYTAAARGGGA